MAYLLKGGIVATFDKDNKPRSFKADILVQESIIAEIAEDIPVSAGTEVIDCTDKWITPGMVDTHRHTWMSLMKGSQCDQLLSEYLVKNTWFGQTKMTPSEVQIGQLAGCLEALDSGVTTILDHFHAGISPEHQDLALEATIQSGARVVFCPTRQSPATKVLPNFEFANDAESAKWQVEKLQEWGRRDAGKLSQDGRVTLGFSIDSVGFGPVETHQKLIQTAREAGVHNITAHIVQADKIHTWKEAGLLGPDVIFSHCNLLYDRTAPDDELWAIMKEHNCAIASTPEDELNMAHGNPVALEAVARGVKCGLGVDCTSINSGDIFTQMRFALSFKRGRTHEKILKEGSKPPKHNGFRSTDAFRLGTLGGAEALNLSHLIGTVEVGKKADLVVFDTNTANLAGCLDPFQGVVFHASNADVELVIVNGNIVKRDGKLTSVDWKVVAKELKQKVGEFRARVPFEQEEEAWSQFYETVGPPRY